mgnify:CR=1 FL=1
MGFESNRLSITHWAEADRPREKLERLGAGALSDAELLAIQHACQHLGRWRLTGMTLYVTIEPCPMCAGAIVMSRISRVVYGSTDTKAGACESLFNITECPALNHQPEMRSGVLAEECSEIIKRFFRARRKSKGAPS